MKCLFNMTLLEELLLYIHTKDRLGLLRFRQKVVRKYGQEKFRQLLEQSTRELKNEV
jgi:hypothetical protein